MTKVSQSWRDDSFLKTTVSEKMSIWIKEWFSECDEMMLRRFLMEVTGISVIRHPFTIVLTKYKEEKSTSSDICSRIIRIPCVRNKNLFIGMMDFRGPFGFTRKL